MPVSSVRSPKDSSMERSMNRFTTDVPVCEFSGSIKQIILGSMLCYDQCVNSVSFQAVKIGRADTKSTATQTWNLIFWGKLVKGTENKGNLKWELCYDSTTLVLPLQCVLFYVLTPLG
jgi:hypothetical protein